MTRERLFRGFFFAAFVFLLWQLLRVFEPFLPAFLWAATLTMVFFPVHERLRRTLPPDAAALLTTIVVLVGVLLPTGVLGYVLAKETAALVPAVRDWLLEARGSRPERFLHPSLASAWDALDRALSGTGLDLSGIVTANLDAVRDAIGMVVAGAAKQAALFALGIVVLAVSLFFSFRHGERLLEWAMDLVPMAASHKRGVMQTLRATFTMVVRGVLANAAVQGLLAGAGFWAAGLRFPVFLSVAVAFASLIPVGGTALVWLPVSVKLMFDGQASGAFLLLWCLCFVTLLDLHLKPLLAGGTTAQLRLPGLILFFSILGGLRVHGLHGILMGPLMITVALAFVRIYREEFYRRPSESAGRQASPAGH